MTCSQGDMEQSYKEIKPQGSQSKQANKLYQLYAISVKVNKLKLKGKCGSYQEQGKDRCSAKAAECQSVANVGI